MSTRATTLHAIMARYTSGYATSTEALTALWRRGYLSDEEYAPARDEADARCERAIRWYRHERERGRKTGHPMRLFGHHPRPLPQYPNAINFPVRR